MSKDIEKEVLKEVELWFKKSAFTGFPYEKVAEHTFFITKQKTAQAIFENYCKRCWSSGLPAHETKQYNSKQFYCNKCILKKLLKENWGVK